MPLPDERQGNSVASILAKFQANVNHSNEAPLIPKARFGQAPPKQQQHQTQQNIKPPPTYGPPTKPVSLPADLPKPATSTGPTGPRTQPSASPPSAMSSPERDHKPVLAPVITKPSVDVVPDVVPGSADKLLGVQVEGLGCPSSPQAETGRLSAPSSPLCNSPPPVSVPFPSTEEPESPTQASRRLSSVSAISHASTTSALSARSGATPTRKHSTAAAPTTASLAKARPRVESTTRKSPARLRSSPVLTGSPTMSTSTLSTASARTSPTEIRSKPTTPVLGAGAGPSEMARSRSGSTGSAVSSMSGVRNASGPSNGTPRSRTAAAGKPAEPEAVKSPRTSTSPQTTRPSASAKSTPRSKSSTTTTPRTSAASNATASAPATNPSPLASRSAPSSKPGTPSSSGRATPSAKHKTTVAKPFSFGRPRKPDAGTSAEPDSDLAGLGISQSDTEADAQSTDARSDAEEPAAEPVKVPEANDPDPTTPTRSASQGEQADEQPTPRAPRFEGSTAAESDERPPTGKVFEGGAGGRPFGRIPIPMEDDGQGGLRPKAAEELDGLKPELVAGGE